MNRATAEYGYPFRSQPDKENVMAANLFIVAVQGSFASLMISVPLYRQSQYLAAAPGCSFETWGPGVRLIMSVSREMDLVSFSPGRHWKRIKSIWCVRKAWAKRADAVSDPRFCWDERTISRCDALGFRVGIKQRLRPKKTPG